MNILLFNIRANFQIWELKRSGEIEFLQFILAFNSIWSPNFWVLTLRYYPFLEILFIEISKQTRTTGWTEQTRYTTRILEAYYWVNFCQDWDFRTWSKVKKSEVLSRNFYKFCILSKSFCFNTNLIIMDWESDPLKPCLLNFSQNLWLIWYTLYQNII